MAFIVEDGSIVPDANSYVSVEFADEYFGDRSVSEWTGSDPIKQGALIRATDYIESRFAGQFVGSRVSAEQSLSWPRNYTAYKNDVVPREVQRACCEYAVRALAGNLAPDIDVTDGVARIKVREKLGPIEDEWRLATTDSGGARFFLIKPYPAADMLLKGLLRIGGRVIR